MNREKLLKVWKEENETIFLWKHGINNYGNDYAICYNLLDFSIRGTFKDIRKNFKEIFKKQLPYDYRTRDWIKQGRFEELIQLLLENNDNYYDCKEFEIKDNDTLYFILENMEITVFRNEIEKIEEYIEKIKNR